jgi:hypothetical protein
LIPRSQTRFERAYRFIALKGVTVLYRPGCRTIRNTGHGKECRVGQHGVEELTLSDRRIAILHGDGSALCKLCGGVGPEELQSAVRCLIRSCGCESVD